MLKKILAALLLLASIAQAQEKTVEVRADVLEDKIRGGMLGQILGNLNGLPHEMKYIAEPGKVEKYVPALPEGARTDDDTDIEWVYLLEMQKSGQLLIPQKRITELWKAHINRSIWCANEYARQLMEIGIEPPLSGYQPINPWAVFNISGSFLAETWGLVAPGMPQTSAKIALNLTHVAIEWEPAQTTQFVTAMIATSFFESEIDKILEAGLAAVDQKSVIHKIYWHVRGLHQQHPGDWRKARLSIRDHYTRFDGEMADRNGVELNTAATIAGLLYGRGDFVETMRMEFNFGWDADNNAATAGAILGVIKGRKWMDEQKWEIKDIYRNTTRDAMPMDETITRFSDRVVEVARKAILENGGEEFSRDGAKHYRIKLEPPRNLEPLTPEAVRAFNLTVELHPQIERELAGSPLEQARAAYLAICLGMAEEMQRQNPGQWKSAIAELQKQKIVKSLFAAPRPMGPVFQKKATEAGLQKPGK
jgi:hypothetical protein